MEGWIEVTATEGPPPENGRAFILHDARKRLQLGHTQEIPASGYQRAMWATIPSATQGKHSVEQLSMDLQKLSIKQLEQILAKSKLQAEQKL